MAVLGLKGTTLLKIYKSIYYTSSYKSIYYERIERVKTYFFPVFQFLNTIIYSSIMPKCRMKHHIIRFLLRLAQKCRFFSTKNSFQILKRSKVSEYSILQNLPVFVYLWNTLYVLDLFAMTIQLFKNIETWILMYFNIFLNIYLFMVKSLKVNGENLVAWFVYIGHMYVKKKKVIS